MEHHFDIDLVLYSRSKPPAVINTLSIGINVCVGFTVEKAVRDGYDEHFDKIDSCLEEYLGDDYCPEDERTDVAIKFEIQLPRQSPIGVDLILSPYFSDQHDLLRSLRRVDDKSKRLKL